MARMAARLTAAFDVVARVRPCDGGEENGSADESFVKMVTSFIEREGMTREERDDEKMRRKGSGVWSQTDNSCSSDSETEKDALVRLFRLGSDIAVQKVFRDVEEIAWWSSTTDHQKRDGDRMKRLLVKSLRDKGFDAGLCNSTWDRTSRRPAGRYQYIDINVGGTRYIVEVSLAGHFEIARPSDHYASLIAAFPPVFVGRPDELKQVIKLMCRAMKRCMNRAGLLIPPWRSKSYMLAKWFSAANQRSTSADDGVASARHQPALRHKSSAVEISYYCRDDFASKPGLRIGHLTAVFSGEGVGM